MTTPKIDPLANADLDELACQFALTRIGTISPRTKLLLIESFHAARLVFAATAAALQAAGLNDRQIAAIHSTKNIDREKDEIRRILDSGTGILSCLDTAYPSRLKETAAYPLLLYFRGDVKILEERFFLAVVGSRQMTEYGRKVLRELIPELVAAGFVIVSGMAFGVDASAHEFCLEAGGRTIAVQAQGVDLGYPRTNQKLYEGILRNGLVISEFPYCPKYMGPELFPRRNRLVSGLSDGVLVIEAKMKSGSLITAYFGLEQNRHVYAVPGNIHQESSQGCLLLLRNGAKMVVAAQDIVEDFDCMNASTGGLSHDKVGTDCPTRIVTDTFESPLEARIFTLCADQSLAVDEIVELTGEAAPRVSAVLTKMELTGRLEAVDGRKFRSVT